MLSNSAFNALLKTLEEPPDHVIFVLATTEPEKIPATITSRCQRFEFKRISLSDIVGRLRHIVDEEGVQVEQIALEHIARQGGGSMRDSISLLDQLIAYGDATITFELVQRVLGAVGIEPVSKLVEALIAGQVGQGLDIINQIVRDGVDPRQFTREIVSYLRELLLVKLGNGAQLLHLPAEQLTIMQTQAEQAATPLILHSTKLFNQAANDIKAGMLDIPQLPLELALVEALTVSTTPAVTAQPPTPSPPTPSPHPKSSPPAAKPTSQVHVPVDTGHLSYDVVRSKLEQVYADLLEGRTKNKRPGIRIAKTLQHSAQLVKVAGHEIHFSTSQDNKERFEKPQPREAINWVFSQVLGQDVQVIFTNKEQTRPADTVAETDDAAINELIEVAQKLGGEVKP